MSYVVLLGGPHHGMQVSADLDENGVLQLIGSAEGTEYVIHSECVNGVAVAYPLGFDRADKREALERWPAYRSFKAGLHTSLVGDS